jgi:hypothetical protein
MLKHKDLSDDQYEELNRKLDIHDGDILYIGFQPPELTVLPPFVTYWVGVNVNNIGRINSTRPYAINYTPPSQ